MISIYTNIGRDTVAFLSCLLAASGGKIPSYEEFCEIHVYPDTGVTQSTQSDCKDVESYASQASHTITNNYTILEETQLKERYKCRPSE
jgi:hypothetical protein